MTGTFEKAWSYCIFLQKNKGLGDKSNEKRARGGFDFFTMYPYFLVSLDNGVLIDENQSTTLLGFIDAAG